VTPSQKARWAKVMEHAARINKRLVVHRDGSLSIRVRHGRKDRWLHHCDWIEEADFKRLSEGERERIKALKIPITQDFKD